ncbi:MAG: RagB/SusD family nutrient uptake outer membrane protein [Thermaurantimonas sp.]
MKKSLTFTLIWTAAGLIGMSSCSKIFDVRPEGVLLIEEALQTPEDFEKVLNSCYDVAANYYNGRIQMLNDVLGDNVAPPINNNDLNEVYLRRVNFFNGTTNGVYREPYRSIFRINFMIENFGMVDMPVERRRTFEAEGRFLRALGHFEIIRLWAQPYGYTVDNGHLGIRIQTQNTGTQLQVRSTVKEGYDAILADLWYAKDNLPNTNGNYATRFSAMAALAKVYFQMNKFDSAAFYAGQVISSGQFSLEGIDRFKMGPNTEAIFQTVSTQTPTLIDGRSGAFTGNYRSDNNPNPTLRASKDFYNLISSRPNDTRLTFYEVRDQGLPTEFVAVAKFNKDIFSVPVLHLTDMMLIRAESLAELSQNLPEAINLINQIRERAFGDSSENLSSSASALEIRDAARLERRIEMFGEGDRAQDLKRRGAKGENIVVRGAPWNCPGMVLQFPASDINETFFGNPEGGCN